MRISLEWKINIEDSDSSSKSYEVQQVVRDLVSMKKEKMSCIKRKNGVHIYVNS